MKVNSIAPAGAFPMVKGFDPIGAFEGKHGSLTADFDAMRMNAKHFKSKSKKLDMLTLTPVEGSKERFSAVAGSFVAYAEKNPESKLVRIYNDDKFDINPAIPFSRKNGQITEEE